jgi:hypothetical protein
MCGYVACVTDCRGSEGSNSEGSKKLPDDGRLLPKHVGANIQNKGLVQSVHIVGYIYHVSYS